MNNKSIKTCVNALMFFICSVSLALTPSEILIVANSANNDSLAIAQHYAKVRNVPVGNILILDLKTSLSDSISRNDYNNFIAGPVKLEVLNRNDTKIRCIILTYGVPYKVGKKTPDERQKQQIIELTEKADAATAKLHSLLIQTEGLGKTELMPISSQSNPIRKNLLKDVKPKFDNAKKRIEKMADSPVKTSHLRNYNNLYQQVIGNNGLAQILSNLDINISYLNGEETNASVDSELSMAMFDNYELFRYQPNLLKGSNFYIENKTLMVCRIDGPSAEIANNLVDKAVSGKLKDFKGIAYFDARGISDGHSVGSFGYYDNAIRNAADIVRASAITTVLDNNEQLFQIGQCPQTILYCGWYSLKKYIPSFTFADGAIGYHIASWEAIDIHDANSTQWVPAMLKNGITATLGAVAEPYLHAFPEPDKFFSELLMGSCLVEAYYKTNPFNSWQLILIGDPLYKPF